MAATYFLRIDHDGISQIGGWYASAPSDEWKPGGEGNYLQRWDGRAWAETPKSAAFRESRDADVAAAMAAKTAKDKADTRPYDLLLSLLRDLHVRVSDDERARGRPVKEFEQWKADADAKLESDKSKAEAVDLQPARPIK